jgi:hypothetical protein
LYKVTARNHNVFNIIQKQNTKACSGKHNCHWEQKTNTPWTQVKTTLICFS